MTSLKDCNEYMLINWNRISELVNSKSSWIRFNKPQLVSWLKFELSSRISIHNSAGDKYFWSFGKNREEIVKQIIYFGEQAKKEGIKSKWIQKIYHKY